MKRLALKALALILLLCTVFSFALISCNDTGNDDGTSVTTGGKAEEPENTTADVTTEKEDTTTMPDETTTGADVSPDVKPEDTKYKYVAVIGVDGAGAFFKEANTPNIDKIFANGAVTYKCLTANPTISAQCWGSLLHGVVPSVHGLTNAIAKETPYPTDSNFPSFFRVIRENDASATLASFSHWNPINVGIVEDGIGVHKVGDLSDAALTNEICNYISANNPTALFVQFDEADGAGHSSGYGTPVQFQKISEIDTYIGRIYDAYEKKGILDETLFIVTADHGGSGKSHGGLSDAEKYVMFAATGKTVQKGEIQDVEIRDTAAIVLHALGYTNPESWTARVPSGLFKGVSATERPIYVNKDSERYHESEPTPTKGSDGYITNFIKDHKLNTYLTFDGDITDACEGNITKTGNLYFVDGYFGQGVSLDDGHVSINNYNPGKDSFTVALWIQTEGMDSDPCIISNKDWLRGRNPGYVLSLRYGESLRFNMGDDVNRVDADADLPADFREGWLHIILIVDRELGKISICYDFGALTTTDIPANLMDDSLNAFSSLNIGQDGTGKYKVGLPATVDEFMIFDGVLSRENITALANYYGKAKEDVPHRDSASSATPEKDSSGYITNFIKDKELDLYLTFDGNANDTMGNNTPTVNGSVSYENGFFGQGIKLDSGYVSLKNYDLGKDSFSVAFWIKSEGVEGDPSIISNKSWKNGKNPGFIVSLREQHDIKLNLGDGSNRADGEFKLPGDYQEGWMYVIAVFDREKNEMRVSYDFNEFTVIKMTESIKNASADGPYDVLNIGQDGTGTFGCPLYATLDEFMLFKGALDSDDIKALSEYFGIEKN